VWHHPRWDWLKYQKADWTQSYELRRTAPLYRLAYKDGVDLLLAGHNHNYSRWTPADPDSDYEPAHGITQITMPAGLAPAAPIAQTDTLVRLPYEGPDVLAERRTKRREDRARACLTSRDGDLSPLANFSWGYE
jgi:hypothetical protein